MMPLLQRPAERDVPMDGSKFDPARHSGRSPRNWCAVVKRFFGLLIIASFIAFLPALSPAGADEPDGLRQAVLDEMARYLKLTELTDGDITRVFSVRFFQTEVEWQGGWVHHLFAWRDGKAYPLAFEGTTLSSDSLVGALKPDLKIHGRDDIKTLRAGFAKVLKFGDLEPGVPEFGRYQGKWVIVDGTFFDDLSGYIVDVDQDGKPTGFRRELKIKKDELKQMP